LANGSPNNGYVRPEQRGVIERFGTKVFGPKRFSGDDKKKLRRLSFLAKRFLLRNQYVVYKLYFLHGGMAKNIAKILSVKLFDVKNEIRRVRKTLRLYYEFYYVHGLKDKAKGMTQHHLRLVRDILNLQERVRVGLVKNEYVRKKNVKGKDGKK